MMLAPTLAGNTPITAAKRRWRATRGIALDLVILAIAAAACGLLLFDGGLEALLGAAAGALLSGRNATSHTARGAVAGALGGLFAGALFAGFFHEPIAMFVVGL